MLVSLRLLLQLTVLGCMAALPMQTSAGALHRCDDGGGVSIYQTLPCGAGQRTIERREYAEPVSPLATGGTAENRSRARQATPSPRAGTPRMVGGKPTSAATVAHECQWRGARWVQADPCEKVTEPARGRDTAASVARRPSQRALTREEACRRVRDARTERAPGERPADSVYRRNLLRDRGRC